MICINNYFIRDTKNYIKYLSGFKKDKYKDIFIKKDKKLMQQLNIKYNYIFTKDASIYLKFNKYIKLLNDIKKSIINNNHLPKEISSIIESYNKYM